MNTFETYKPPQVKCVAKLESSLHSIPFLIHLIDGRLLSYCTEGVFKFWDVSSFECLETVTNLPKNFSHLFQLHNCNLASVSGHETIAIWDSSTIEVICYKNTQVDMIIQLADGRLLYSKQKSCFLIDSSSLEQLACVEVLDPIISVVQISPQLAVICKEKATQVLNVTTLQCEIISKEMLKEMWAVDQLIPCGDRRLIFISSSTLSIKCENEKDFFGLNFLRLRDGRIVSQDRDSAIKLFDGKTLQSIVTVELSQHFLRAMIQLRNGRIALSFSLGVLDNPPQPDTLIQIWEVSDITEGQQQLIH